MAGIVWDSSRRVLWMAGIVWDSSRRTFGWQALSGVAVEELLGGRHCLG